MANSNLQRKLCKRCLALKSTKGCEQDEKSKKSKKKNSGSMYSFYDDSFAFCRLCGSRAETGKTPAWAHSISNKGSMNTALKCGFVQDRINTVIRKRIAMRF